MLSEYFRIFATSTRLQAYGTLRQKTKEKGQLPRRQLRAGCLAQTHSLQRHARLTHLGLGRKRQGWRRLS